jgi:hypothetical protein
MSLRQSKNGAKNNKERGKNEMFELILILSCVCTAVSEEKIE